jgi:hypothetical protein
MRHVALVPSLLIGLALCSPAQDKLHTVSSVPLPADLQDKLGGIQNRMGCGDDGSILITRMHPLTEAADPIVRLGSNGLALARINVETVAGLEKALVADFAPGPNGETYVLAYKVLKEMIRPREDGEVRSIGRKLDSQPTLLRFDSKGELIFSRHLEQLQQYGGPYAFAVFDTGDILLLDIGPSNPKPEALMLNPDGKLLKTISIAATALDESKDERADARPFHYLPVTAISSRDKVFLVAGEEVPSVAVVSRQGEVLYSSRLQVPAGYWINTPRISDEHVYAKLQLAPRSQAQGANGKFVEFDTHTGMLVAMHSVPSSVVVVACQTPKGMSFFHIEEKENFLEIMEPATPNDEDVVH